MRKIEKDLLVVPQSLYDNSTRNGKKTNRKRKILMCSTSRYKKAYDECYKWNDIQNELSHIYHNKCVYCEEKITRVNATNLSGKEEVSHTVEHYRPKSKYGWLAFSWDNLLWCCKKCTDIKDDKFDINNVKVNYSPSFDSKIHCSTKLYNRLERPKMIHPELEDVMNKLIFDTKGNISSHDDRVQYTIKCCELDRTYLNGKRKKIYDRFFKKLEDAIAQNNQELINSILLKFKEDSENMDNEFIAFRIWVLNWIVKNFT